MGLFSFFSKNAVSKEEVINVDEAISPIITEHSNVVDSDDAFSKMFHEEENVEQEEQVQEEITFTQEDTEEYDLFMECLKVEVKKLKASGELSDESVDAFREERVGSFKAGTFKYDEDFKDNVKLQMDMKSSVLEIDEK